MFASQKTLDQWAKDGPYTRTTVRSVARDLSTVSKMADLQCVPGMPVDIRLWFVLRPEYLPERTLLALSCDFVDDIRGIYAERYPNDTSLRDVVVACRSWTEGDRDSVDIASTIAAMRELLDAVKRRGDAAHESVIMAAMVMLCDGSWRCAYRVAVYCLLAELQWTGDNSKIGEKMVDRVWVALREQRLRKICDKFNTQALEKGENTDG